VLGLNKNWSENVVFAASEIYEPLDIKDIIKTIQRANREERRIKVVGSGHSFNDIADTDGIQMSLKKHFNFIEINKEAKEVTFGAGVSFIELSEALDENQLALRNVPSHPHINVVGAVVTGSHGSGKNR
jgi:xylitol oxidase